MRSVAPSAPVVSITTVHFAAAINQPSLLSELAAMADAGTLNDMKTLVLVQTLRIGKPELFRL